MKSYKLLVAVLLAMTFTGVLCSKTSFADQGNGWTFIVKPYALGANIEGDASIGRATGANVDVDFDAILENLEAAFMIDVAAYHKSGWGIILDYAFMDLESDISGPRGGILAADVYQGVFEALVAKRFALGKGNWEAFAGIRWWDNDIDITVDPAILPGSRSASVEEDWVDPIIGAFVGIPATDKFTIIARADVGGFGLSSDWTAAVSGGCQYRFTDMISLEFQYKALWVDYEDGTRGTPGYFEYNTVTHGPLLGLMFEF